MLAYIDYPSWIQPQIIPGLPFQWYGLMYLVAFAISYLLMRVQIKERGLDVQENVLMDFFFWGIVGLLVGARLFAALIFEESGFYWRNPHRIFWPFNSQGQFVGIQGMNFYGGLLGAAIAFWAYARIKKIDLLEWGDMLVAGVPLGYTFGRLGNFINAELYGRVTAAPWGIVFPTAEPFPASEEWVRETAARAGMEIPADPGAFINLPRHPTQLYEAFTEGILAWLVIWFLFRKRIPFRGFIVAFYILWYGAWRFLIDYFRMPLGSDYVIRLAADPTIPPYRLLTPWNFILSQVWSFLMIVAGVGLLLAFHWWDRRRQLALEQRVESQRGTSRRRMRKQIAKKR